ncbi:nudix hydrolase 14, chloroplastic isoform X2 [Populus nigra]|uniref:nudix hydrolase 14, chloroplastic isoform X2 n=1 Tax=Populus nigra TaxID=3691 RepID=UPI002B26FD49|nr:nudix hydrolase 14, chloroplastic isoform X2 [Populus nigra]
MSLLSVPKRLLLGSSLAVSIHNQTRKLRRPFCFNMSSESSQPLTHSLTLPTQLGQPIQIIAAPGVSDSQFRTAIESSLFKQWLKNLESENGILATGSFLLKQVLVQGVDMFGQRIGFLKFKADIFEKETGQKIPGIVFARGPAVTVLILLSSEGETYAVLTEQVEEETGIHLKLGDMVDLTAFLDPSTGGRVFPSPGGCDEEISVFLYRGCVGKEIITQLQGKETGLRENGELIKVRVVPYKELWRMTADAKVLMAIALYEMAKGGGLLPLKT